MTKQSEPEEREQAKASPPFHKRFNIEIGSEKARENFVSRVLNLIEVCFPKLEEHYINRSEIDSNTLRLIATELGIKYDRKHYIRSYVEGDFTKLLHMLEATYKVLGWLEEGEKKAETLEVVVIQGAISKSEVDLGVEWKSGIFIRSGAKLLDEALVDENLRWLSEPKYADVLAPFEKGLRHFLEARRRPEKLMDVITDMYEALEKMARITNGNNNNLGSNAEQFSANLGLSDHYETMLREYAKYAHEFRHAVKQGKERVPPLAQEAEAFVYTTGLFIRLAIQMISAKP